MAKRMSKAETKTGLAFDDLERAKRRVIHALQEMIDSFEIKHSEIVGHFEYLNEEEHQFIGPIRASLELLETYLSDQLALVGGDAKLRAELSDELHKVKRFIPRVVKVQKPDVRLMPVARDLGDFLDTLAHKHLPQKKHAA